MRLRFPGSLEPLSPRQALRISDREAPAREGGLDPSAVQAIWAAVERWYQSGLSPAIALCLRRQGAIILDRSIGLRCGAQQGRRELATPDTLFNIFSASKMVVGILVHQARERGELELDAAVARYIPAFAQAGKQGITVRDVLAHRSGLPGLNEPTTLELVNDRRRIVDWLCRTPPRLRPGRLAYHALTGGYILAEVLERTTGLSVQELLQRDIAGPLGLSHFRYGVERRDLDRVAENVFTGLPTIPPISYFVRRSLGASAETATRLSNNPRFTDAVIPAGNLVTSAEQACRFMEALRCGGQVDGRRILDADTLADSLAEHSHLEMDQTLILPVRYGLGFMLGGRLMSLYGTDTKEAFGHLGFMQVVLWADPERQISGALLTSGKTFMSPGLLYFAAVMQTIARRCPKRSA